MGLLLLSALGLPFMAIVVFALIEAVTTKAGLWMVLSNAGLDICRVSIGIAGAMFLDVKIRAAGTYSALVILIELVLGLVAMLIDKRAVDMRIEFQSTKAFSILGCGVVSMVIPAVLVVLSEVGWL